MPSPRCSALLFIGLLLLFVSFSDAFHHAGNAYMPGGGDPMLQRYRRPPGGPAAAGGAVPPLDENSLHPAVLAKREERKREVLERRRIRLEQLEQRKKETEALHEESVRRKIKWLEDQRSGEESRDARTE